MARDGSLLSVGAMAGFNSRARPAVLGLPCIDAAPARPAFGRLRLPAVGDAMLPRYNVAQTIPTFA